MAYDTRKQAEEALRRRSDHDRLGHLERLAAARLKAFDWSDECLGIRRKDVAVFTAAARVFDVIILVRSTNPAPDDTAVVKHREVRLGLENIHRRRQREVEDFVNRGIGAPMIQHGEQFLFAHQQDTVFIFTPTGTAYAFNEPASSIEEIVRLLYHVTG